MKPEELRQKIEDAGMPKDARDKALGELHKLNDVSHVFRGLGG